MEEASHLSDFQALPTVRYLAQTRWAQSIGHAGVRPTLLLELSCPTLVLPPGPVQGLPSWHRHLTTPTRVVSENRAFAQLVALTIMCQATCHMAQLQRQRPCSLCP